MVYLIPNPIVCFANLVIPNKKIDMIIKIQIYLFNIHSFLCLQIICKIQDEYQINRSFVDMYGGFYFGVKTNR